MKRRPRTSTLVLAVGFALLPWFVDRALRVNTTPSLPRGVYLLTDRPLRRGTLVLACLPEPVARHGRARGYLAPGRCPGGAVPVLKRIAALPGDVVLVGEGGLAVNGRPLVGTARRRTDSRGRRLLAIASGPYVVGEGEVWLFSRHVPESWDSRYYGPISLGQITSTGFYLVGIGGS